MNAVQVGILSLVLQDLCVRFSISGLAPIVSDPTKSVLPTSSKMDLITLKLIISSPTYDILCEACDIRYNVKTNSLQRYDEKVRIRFGHVHSWIHA